MTLSEAVEILKRGSNHKRSCRCDACHEIRRLWAELVRDAESSRGNV